MANQSATEKAARYISDARHRIPSEDAVESAKRHVLDTFLAMISGSQLPAGQKARAYVEAHASAGPCTIIGSEPTARPELAALANGMSAHADETDDVNDISRTHPGASTVPAALASAEAEGATGSEFLRAVMTGYTIGSIISLTAWTSVKAMQKAVRSPHGVGQTFGAAAAAAALAKLPWEDIRIVLAYAAQQSSGFTSFYRDQQHIEKAFASSGMQAHAGVRAVEFVKAGFSGVLDILDGSPSVFDAFGDRGSNEGLVELLEADADYTALTDLKRFPSGMPTQAALECVQTLFQENSFNVDQVAKVVVRLPSHGARVVGNRTMPDIDVRYVVAIMLSEGDLSFAASHDYERRRTAGLTGIRDKVELVADSSLDGEIDGVFSTRRAQVAIHLTDGRVMEHRVLASYGSRLRPLGWEEMSIKAHRILGWRCAAPQIDELIALMRQLDKVAHVGEIRKAVQALLT
jgi:2-methylcitrate dehydratase PrpD